MAPAPAPSPLHPDRAAFGAWALALVPPLAWFAHLCVSYLLVPASCRAGHPGWLLIASAPALVGIVGALMASRRRWRDHRRPASARTAGAAGFGLGWLFLLASLVLVAAGVVVDPCW